MENKKEWPHVCPKCRGMSIEKIYCPMCKGSGFVTRKKAIKEYLEEK